MLLGAYVCVGESALCHNRKGEGAPIPFELPDPRSHLPERLSLHYQPPHRSSNHLYQLSKGAQVKTKQTRKGKQRKDNPRKGWFASQAAEIHRYDMQG